MKCFYYLSPTLESTGSISEDLREAGISDWFVHIVSRDQAGISRERLHSSNYIETMDFMRHGLMGAAMGFAAGLVFALIMYLFEPVGPGVPVIAYAGMIFLLTCFGAWQGGLVGISKENRKLAAFHDDIAAGRYLILVYAGKNHEEAVRQVMKKRHPEAVLAGVDARFYNPFAVPVLMH